MQGARHERKGSSHGRNDEILGHIDKRSAYLPMPAQALPTEPRVGGEFYPGLTQCTRAVTNTRSTLEGMERVRDPTDIAQAAETRLL